MNKMSPGTGEMYTVTNISTGKVITHIPTSGGNITEAVKSVREAKESWCKMQGHIRARHLYRSVLVLTYCVKMLYSNVLIC